MPPPASKGPCFFLASPASPAPLLPTTEGPHLCDTSRTGVLTPHQGPCHVQGQSSKVHGDGRGVTLPARRGAAPRPGKAQHPPEAQTAPIPAWLSASTQRLWADHPRLLWTLKPASCQGPAPPSSDGLRPPRGRVLLHQARQTRQRGLRRPCVCVWGCLLHKNHAGEASRNQKHMASLAQCPCSPASSPQAAHPPRGARMGPRWQGCAGPSRHHRQTRWQASAPPPPSSARFPRLEARSLAPALAGGGGPRS